MHHHVLIIRTSTILIWLVGLIDFNQSMKPNVSYQWITAIGLLVFHSRSPSYRYLNFDTCRNIDRTRTHKELETSTGRKPHESIPYFSLWASSKRYILRNSHAVHQLLKRIQRGGLSEPHRDRPTTDRRPLIHGSNKNRNQRKPFPYRHGGLTVPGPYVPCEIVIGGLGRD